MRASLGRLQPYAIAALFLLAGVAHFVWATPYERIVPNYLPAHRALVLASGAFEILGGIGALFPATRRAAGWGLIVLLLAVFPANVDMATHAASFAGLAPAWALYARPPLQFALIAWVYAALIRR